MTNAKNNVARALVALCMGLFPNLAAAQDVPARQAPPADQTVQHITQSSIVVERIKSGFVVAPDVKVTEVDDDVANLVGAYAGWLTDGRLLLGGGGYWLTNRDDDFKMAYGGLVVSWLMRSDRRVGFDVRTLVGGGSATLSTTLSDLLGRPVELDRGVSDAGGFRSGGRRRGQRASGNERIIFREEFFVVEPQVDLVLKVTDRVWLTTGVGYRLIGAARRADDELRGVSGSFAVQIGNGW